MSDSPEKMSRSIRALELVEAVSAAGYPVTIPEIVTATGLPRATVHRLVSMLEREGFLQKDLSGRGYIEGFRLIRLANSVIGGSGARALRHRIMTDLSDELGETCNLAAPDGGYMVYLDRVELKWHLGVQFAIGSHVPLHCTASGKLYLSSLPREQRRRMIRRLEMERFTERTITDPAKLEEEVDRIAETGIGTDNEEHLDSMVAASVPVLDGSGRLCATLSVHAAVMRMSLDKAVACAPILRRAAAELSTLNVEIATGGAQKQSA
jgi:DNA-binding IclR family transcriptional regulator